MFEYQNGPQMTAGKSGGQNNDIRRKITGSKKTRRLFAGAAGREIIGIKKCGGKMGK